MIAPETGPQAAPSVERRGTQALQRTRQVLIGVLGLNLAVATAKLTTGTAIGSMALLADGWHSAFDCIATIVGLIGVTAAARPPDREHPYGHRRFEVAAALAIATLLLLAGWEVFTHALDRYGSGQAPRIGYVPFVVMVVSMGVSAAVARWEGRVGLALNSRVLLADATHTRSDVFTSLAVIGTLLATAAGYAAVDMICAAGIGLVIARMGYRIVRDALAVLSDRAPIDPEKVADLFRSRPELGRIHGVRCRSNGADVFMDMLVYHPPSITVARSHAITEEIEEIITDAFPAVIEIVVHVEPEP